MKQTPNISTILSKSVNSNALNNDPSETIENNQNLRHEVHEIFEKTLNSHMAFSRKRPASPGDQSPTEKKTTRGIKNAQDF